MSDKELLIPYTRLPRSEWPEIYERLEAVALEATRRSYAPYSHFHVGAAVQLESGELVLGCNQENASFSPTLCAERTALYAIGAQHPDAVVERLMIVAETEGKRVHPISPCGVCRQVMMETVRRQGKPFEVILCGTDEAIVISDCRLLLPFAFDGSDIPS